MFEFLLAAAGGISILAVICALDGSHDVFHPLVFIAPMFGFLYCWMPWKLLNVDGLSQYLYNDQMLFVQTLNLLGVTAFVGACLAVGLRVPATEHKYSSPSSPLVLRRLLIGGCVAGAVGLTCWAITIINVGGFVNAFSSSYAGGWDDNGYVRDGTLLMLVGLLMAITARSAGASKWLSYTMMAIFGIPWLSSSLLMARRGPTFAFVVIVLMGWYIDRRKRPPILAVGLVGVLLGWLVLFLVTNRQSIYLGSEFDIKTDVGDVVEKSDTGNEWIYGAGTVLSSEQRGHYFWLRRYAAQILVRPIPSALWPTKYEDFGVPELLHNAGTGEGFGDALGWDGAEGSAPGIVADLWVEAWWLAVPLMGILGWGYGYAWKKAATKGGPWSSQFVVLSALSIYLVMQTMEAVIFRTLMLSIPCWLTWRWALAGQKQQQRDSSVPCYIRPNYDLHSARTMTLRSSNRV
ncbi:hypothetical protein [Silvibacterium sp.]|uniref:hypothetical protein n=1 Tax=Silvibacterium sp. TaxID=1964179 RepID=UPI0039E5EF17